MNPSEPLPAAKLLARNLRRLREQHGLTIDDLSRATGIARLGLPRSRWQPLRLTSTR